VSGSDSGIELGPPTRTDAAYFAVRSQILDGTLQAGSRVDQTLLSESLGLSMTPLREALRRLEADHLVIRDAHRGVTVAPISPRELCDLLAVRTTLDSMAVRLTALQRTPDDLEEAAAVLQGEGYNVLRYPRLDTGSLFHRTLFKSCQNQVLIDALESVWARTERYAALLRTSDPASAQHFRSLDLNLFKAVEQQDPDGAERSIRARGDLLWRLAQTRVFGLSDPG
jgi:DNA-binding GntR family transcriptional regulator